MSKLRVGIIGCGFIAPMHIGGYIKCKEVEIVALCDVIKERADNLKENHNLKDAVIYTDYKKMLSEQKLDICSVCTENNLHAKISIAALKAGCHVMCEKPMAITGAEADLMVAASKKSGRKLTVGYQLRFSSEALLLHREIQKGALGHIYFAEASALRRRGVPTWGVFLNLEKQGGGPLIDIGTHLVDRTLWFMNEYSPIVSAVGRTFDHLIPLGGFNNGGHWDIDNFEVEDSAFGTVTFESGAVLVVKTSWAANVKDMDTSLSLLMGVNGGAELKNKELTLNGESCDHLWQRHPETFDDNASHMYMYDDEIAAWVDAVVNDKEPVVTCEQAAHVVKVLEAIYQSARNGGKAVNF